MRIKASWGGHPIVDGLSLKHGSGSVDGGMVGQWLMVVVAKTMDKLVTTIVSNKFLIK